MWQRHGAKEELVTQTRSSPPTPRLAVSLHAPSSATAGNIIDTHESRRRFSRGFVRCANRGDVALFGKAHAPQRVLRRREEYSTHAATEDG